MPLSKIPKSKRHYRYTNIYSLKEQTKRLLNIKTLDHYMAGERAEARDKLTRALDSRDSSLETSTVVLFPSFVLQKKKSLIFFGRFAFSFLKPMLCSNCKQTNQHQLCDIHESAVLLYNLHETCGGRLLLYNNKYPAILFYS